MQRYVGSVLAHYLTSTQQQGLNMSYIAIQDPVGLSRKLTSSDKVLYGYIRRYIDIGECFATNEHFAELLGWSVRTVKRSIKSLIDNGFLNSKVERNGHIISKRILYISGSIEVGTKMAPPTTEGRDKNGPRVGTKMAHIITEVNNRELDNTNVLSLSKTSFDEQNLNKEKNKVTIGRLFDAWKEFSKGRKDLPDCRTSGPTRTDKNNFNLFTKTALKSRCIEDELLKPEYHDLKTVDGWIDYWNDLCDSAQSVNRKYKKFSWAIRDKTRELYETNSYSWIGEMSSEDEKHLTHDEIEKIILKEMENG